MANTPRDLPIRVQPVWDHLPESDLSSLPPMVQQAVALVEQAPAQYGLGFTLSDALELLAQAQRAEDDRPTAIVDVERRLAETTRDLSEKLDEIAGLRRELENTQRDRDHQRRRAEQFLKGSQEGGERYNDLLRLHNQNGQILAAAKEIVEAKLRSPSHTGIRSNSEKIMLLRRILGLEG